MASTPTGSALTAYRTTVRWITSREQSLSLVGGSGNSLNIDDRAAVDSNSKALTAGYVITPNRVVNDGGSQFAARSTFAGITYPGSIGELHFFGAQGAKGNFIVKPSQTTSYDIESNTADPTNSGANLLVDQTATHATQQTGSAGSGSWNYDSPYQSISYAGMQQTSAFTLGAGLVSDPVVDSGPNVLTFSIRFRGFTTLDLAALMNSGNAIQVTGPNGYSQLAKATGATLAADGSSVLVTYTAPPPGQNLESSDNGTYTVSIRPNIVFDSVGHELSGPVDNSFNVSVPPLTTSEMYVTSLYSDLLHRKPDPAGLQFWSGLADQHVSPQEIVRGIQGSPEYRTVEVQDTYQKLLHRAADPAGLGFFVGLLAQGGSVEQVERMMLGSAEYFQVRCGGTNAGLVDTLYHDLLNRESRPRRRQLLRRLARPGCNARCGLPGPIDQ